MNKLIFFLIAGIGLIISSCVNDQFGEVDTNLPTSSGEYSSGFFVINEGLFNFGNGELSFYNSNTKTFYNKVFQASNGFSPGDIPFSVCSDNFYLYLVINNSNKIWKLRRDNLKISGYLDNIDSPRWMCIHDTMAYVSSFTQPFLYAINLKEFEVKSHIQTNRPLENLVTVNDELWGLHWSRYHSTTTNNMVMIVNTKTGVLTDSINVGIEPNSMVKDVNGDVWVLCSGGYQQDEKARIFCINPVTHQIKKQINFMLSSDYPISLCSNQAGDTLYFLNKHLYALPFTASSVPSTPIAYSNQSNFYKVSFFIAGNALIVSDAGDYQHDGKVLLFSNNGCALDTLPAGIIPGNIFEVFPVDK